MEILQESKGRTPLKAKTINKKTISPYVKYQWNRHNVLTSVNEALSEYKWSCLYQCILIESLGTYKEKRVKIRGKTTN